MNNVFVVALVAAVMGFGGAWVFSQTQGQGAGASSADGTGDAALLGEQIADLQRELRDLKNPPATLGANAPAGLAASAPDQDAVVEAVLAKVDARVDERVATKMGEMASTDEEPMAGMRMPRRGRKRMNLADAAKELELSGNEEDELRRIYDESMNRFMKLAAGPDGDIEDVKRDLESMRKDPAGARGMMMKYVPNMMKNIGEVMAISSEREAAVVKAVGPEKAKRLNSEFDIVEANPMGRSFRVGASMESEMPRGR